MPKGSDFDRRLAFLILDIGVETLFKTFLQLPEEVTGTKASFSERMKASEGNFHELTQGVKKAAGNRLDNIDLTHIQFYHDLRNKLYHQGNGITVPADKVKGYASIAVECLKSLLEVDLSAFLFIPQEKEQEQAQKQARLEEFERARQELRAQFEELHQVVSLSLEDIEPALVLPSFKKQYEKWIELFAEQHYYWTSKLILEYRQKNIVSEGKHKPEEYAAFLAEIQPTMPRALRDFADKYHQKGDDVIAIATCNDFRETLLNIAITALKLPFDRNYIYFKASIIFDQKPIDSVVSFLGKDVEDPISELMKLSEEVGKEIKEIRDTLLSRTQDL